MNSRPSHDQIPLISHEQWQRQQRRASSECPALWRLLDQAKDPEIPAVSLWELGILQNVEQDRLSGLLTVTITPTYSGCPAVDMMRDDIGLLLQKNGFADYRVNTQLAPPWTTDWITQEGRAKLKHFGIAPPLPCFTPSEHTAGQHPVLAVACPQCDSSDTLMVSEFASTACKAAFKCNACGEAFDYFKPF